MLACIYLSYIFSIVCLLLPKPALTALYCCPHNSFSSTSLKFRLGRGRARGDMQERIRRRRHEGEDMQELSPTYPLLHVLSCISSPAYPLLHVFSCISYLAYPLLHIISCMSSPAYHHLAHILLSISSRVYLAWHVISCIFLLLCLYPLLHLELCRPRAVLVSSPTS